MHVAQNTDSRVTANTTDRKEEKPLPKSVQSAKTRIAFVMQQWLGSYLQLPKTTGSTAAAENFAATSTSKSSAAWASCKLAATAGTLNTAVALLLPASAWSSAQQAWEQGRWCSCLCANWGKHHLQRLWDKLPWLWDCLEQVEGNVEVPIIALPKRQPATKARVRTSARYRLPPLTAYSLSACMHKLSLYLHLQNIYILFFSQV